MRSKMRDILILLFLLAAITTSNFADTDNEAAVIPEVDCPGMHYEYMQNKNVHTEKFRSRWNFEADKVSGCAEACNQVINFDCKTFIFKHFYPGSPNGSCMLSAMSERELEPVKICFGSQCKHDLYHRIGCVPVSCKPEDCPNVSSTYCHDGEEIKEHKSSEDACCPLFVECVCKSQTCPQLPESPTGAGVISFSKKPGCCPKWKVTCNSSACLSEAELRKESCGELGEVITVENGYCCKEAKCVCKSSNCPLPAVCETDEELELFQGKCCNVSRCKPKPKPAAIVSAPAPAPANSNGPQFFPLCGENGKHGNVDPVWCEVLNRADESEQHTYLLFGLVTAFVMLVLIAACCAIVIMTVTLVKVGKNKLA